MKLAIPDLDGTPVESTRVGGESCVRSLEEAFSIRDIDTVRERHERALATAGPPP